MSKVALITNSTIGIGTAMRFLAYGVDLGFSLAMEGP